MIAHFLSTKKSNLIFLWLKITAMSPASQKPYPYDTNKEVVLEIPQSQIHIHNSSPASQSHNGQHSTSSTSSKWSSNMADVAADFHIACCGIFCLPCLSAQVATKAHENCFMPFCPMGVAALRTRIRTVYGIEVIKWLIIITKCFRQ